MASRDERERLIVADSEQFRMGMRETRKALTGGGLLASVNHERIEQVKLAFESGAPDAICGALHEMAGPFNLRMLSTDVDSKLSARAELISTRLAITIAADVVRTGKPALDSLEVLVDAMCHWIDTGLPGSGVAFEDSQSGKAARFMAEDSGKDVGSAEATAMRLHLLARFGPALGAAETVLRMPADIPAAAPPAY